MKESSFGLTKDVVEKITQVFKRSSGIDKVIIYGSRAKGNYKPNSDIDLVICGEGLSTTDLLKVENELDDLLLPYQIDLSVLSQIENADLVNHIHRVGRVFYKKG